MQRLNTKVSKAGEDTINREDILWPGQHESSLYGVSEVVGRRENSLEEDVASSSITKSGFVLGIQST